MGRKRKPLPNMRPPPSVRQRQKPRRSKEEAERGVLRPSHSRSRRSPAKGKPKPTLRHPRSAAVSVTVLMGGNTMLAEAIAKARSKIVLGIETVRIKLAVTGDLLLEIPSQDGAQRADRLAEKIRAILANKEVLVFRPAKCAKLPRRADALWERSESGRFDALPQAWGPPG